MGRTNKTEQPNETASPYQSQPTTSAYPYATPQPTPPRGAMSESESMARDIKEGRLSGFVGNGTVLTGETNFQAMLRVDGHLTGRVTSENGTLIIGSTGKVDANIAVAAAQINGVVNGDIIATEKIELGRTAKIAGNIQTPRLVMDEGAILEGSCTMVKAREAAEKRAADINAHYTSASSSAAVAEPKTYEENEISVAEEYAEIADEDDEAADAAVS
jgi:cytoskeletal protein CcmA (bactofilin family)